MQGFEKFGFNVKPNNDIIYREWAPNALRAYLIGDFSKSRVCADSMASIDVEFHRWLEPRLASDDQGQFWRL